ncbi:MAG: hypothetical protein EOQ40_15140 [Mesorhizobium sp.]|uniref:hypothetical protein n=1 Tax=Mesorhizobium sp. TaxID=1871066 RepID=UPI000FEAA044|nr:hypothetical protein [Mesorhizobium sp.]RWB20399.1 MAG: hypothetical protein EOQ40_15140 [Mesorhizobium sp.]
MPSKDDSHRWSNCMFCGKPVGKTERSREHVLPMWMLRATGDPNRLIRIEADPVSGAEIIRPASTFHFPACRSCNERYGKTLETHAQKAMEALFGGKSLRVGQCYRLLDWLDKVRVGLWIAYNTLHKESFPPKFRIDQRLGNKDRIAIISVDPHDNSRGFGIGGTDNNVFRTTQAGIFLRINNVRIISMSYESFISRFAGMPYAKEIFASADDLNTLLFDETSDGYDLKQDWREFAMPGATIIAQSVFWPGGHIVDARWQRYINRNTVGRLKNKLRVSKPEHLNRFFQTQLISNAEGDFRYYADTKKHLRVGVARGNSDAQFMKTLYVLLMKYVVELSPTRVIDQAGEKRGIVFLAMLWLENALQITFRLREIGIQDPKLIDYLVNELQKVTRMREESLANLQGTCVPEYLRLSS